MFSLPSSTSEDTAILPDAESTQSEPEHENSFVDMIRFSIIALMIVIPIRMFVAQPFIVSGASMADTFHTGEYLIVDQVTYQFSEPKLGDVVIFRYPKDPSKYFIKRIIGVPGDTVVIENAKVTITNETYPEGHTLNEPYIRTMTPAPRLEEVLGDREYFVMGDNRDESSDSRVWGVLQEERIIGRALIRLFPFSAFDALPGAITEETSTTVSN